VDGETTTPSPGSGDRLLDARGLLCPLPVVKTAEALEALPEGGLLEILADDQGVKADLPAFCRSTGHRFLGYHQEGRTIRAFIRKVKK
jgi:TusA-related sulfurtransferase